MPYNESQKNRTMRYVKKLKKIEFRVKPEEYERYKKAAEEAGYKSMRSFCIDALEEKIKKSGAGN